MQPVIFKLSVPCSIRRCRFHGVVSGLVFGLLGMVLVGGLAGCESGKLFPDELPRSPYSRYEALRGGEAPMYERDEFNQERPAIRARLTPQDAR